MIEMKIVWIIFIEENEDIRVLGSWVDMKEDVDMR